MIKRSFGAVSLASSISTEETSFSVRENDNISIKKRLSKEAAKLLKSNQTIFIDSSTTLYNIVKYLNLYKNLVVITNGIKIASEILYRTPHKVILIGGEVTPHSNSALGSAALTQLSGFHMDVAIMSCSGVSINFGFSEASYDCAELKKKSLQNSTTKIVVFDHTKYGTDKAFKTCSINKVDYIVVPEELDNSTFEALKEQGPTVIKTQNNL